MRALVRTVLNLRNGLLTTMAAMTLTLGLPAHAELQSTLKLPVKSGLLVLDGKDPKELGLAKGEPIRLTRKRHQIVFELSDTIGSGSNLERFTSHPFILTFHPVDGQKYTITAPRLTNRRQADAINARPETRIALVNAKGEDIPFEMAILPSRGLQLGRDHIAEVRKFNLTDNEAAAPEFAGMQTILPGSAKPVPTSLNNSENNTAEENAMAAKMLKYWFNEADSNTRKAFLDWAGELEN